MILREKKRVFYYKTVFLMLLLLQSHLLFAANGLQQDFLIGKIINSRTLKSMNLNELVKGVQEMDIVYLSEKHDNPEHHKIQLDILKKMVDGGRKPKLAFEFFSVWDTPALLDFLEIPQKGHTGDVGKEIEKEIREKLGWGERDDNMWMYYFNLLSFARKQGLFVAGLDLGHDQIMRITRKGFESLSHIEKAHIFSTHHKNKNYKNYMFEIFKWVHCGMENLVMQERLYDTWLARNDRMALSLVQIYMEKGNGPVVVIIGGGHTEYGLGVVERVRSMDRKLKQVVIGLQEISVEPSSLDNYLTPLELEGYNSVPPFDYIWFTQRVSDKDPCEEFGEQLRRMKGLDAEGN